jgi:hypothetical protein
MSANSAPGEKQHVQRVEPRQRVRVDLGSAAQEGREERADERPRFR